MILRYYIFKFGEPSTYFSLNSMESGTDFESDLTDIDNFKKIDGKVNKDAVKKHKCPYDGCLSAFNRPWKLDRHINTHTKNRPYKCDFPGCTKNYTNNSHLRRHKSVSHSEAKSISAYLVCPYPDCQKIFSNKWSLKKHSNSHNIDSIKCKICSTCFKKKVHLRQHICESSACIDYKCSVCGDIFDNKLNLKKHERSHKVYKCDEEDCSEEFLSFQLLRRHSKKTHPNWMYCDFCGNSYLNKWNLSEHIQSHLPKDNREVLSCPYEDCGRYYFYRRNLHHHIKSYHNNVNHHCPVCDQTFVTNSKLKSHQKIHFEANKKLNPKKKLQRKPRKDKGVSKKSMAAHLSGIQLPNHIHHSITQRTLNEDDLAYIESVKSMLVEDFSHDDDHDDCSLSENNISVLKLQS